jgi:hypothetical protein
MVAVLAPGNSGPKLVGEAETATEAMVALLELLNVAATIVSTSGVPEPFPRITQTGGVPTTLEGVQLESVWKPTVIAVVVVAVIL